MRTLMIFFVSMLMAHAATARQEPTTPSATEVPPITADRAPLQLFADQILATGEDCSEYAELALQGDPKSIEAFLTCVD